MKFCFCFKLFKPYFRVCSSIILFTLEFPKYSLIAWSMSMFPVSTLPIMVFWCLIRTRWWFYTRIAWLAWWMFLFTFSTMLSLFVRAFVRWATTIATTIFTLLLFWLLFCSFLTRLIFLLLSKLISYGLKCISAWIC